MIFKFQIKTLWLSNLLRILHNLKQYSGEKQFQSECTLKQMEQSLKHFDLSEYRRVLSDVAIWIYQVIYIKKFLSFFKNIW